MAEHSARVVAEAKINLFLRVGELTQTGYHEIQTLFQRIELGDAVTVHANDSSARRLECRGMDVGPPEQNIALKAANLFSAATNWPSGFTIEIDKRVPVGGGLGGGSADAAAVLRALNYLAPDPLSPIELQGIALQLGSDVPFLASGACLAMARGRGEQLRVLPPLPVRGVTLLQMPFSVQTAAAYGWLDALHEARGGPKSRSRVIAPADLTNWEDVARVAENDFEEVVCERHEDLAVVLASIRSADYEMAEMTGSGSTVFAISLSAEPVRAAEHVAPGLSQILTRTAQSAAPIQAA